MNLLCYKLPRYSDKEPNYEAIMKVAVVIPSLFRDEAYLRQCEEAVSALDPKADEVITFRNDGKAGLGFVRSRLFKQAFDDLGCDVALQVSSDFLVHPNILKYVSRDEVTTFTFFARKISMPILMLKFLVSPNVWTGCYSISKEFWRLFKISPWFHSWDGQDRSIIGFAKEQGLKVKRVRVPKYALMRPTTQMNELVRELPLKRKILKMISWF